MPCESCNNAIRYERAKRYGYCTAHGRIATHECITSFPSGKVYVRPCCHPHLGGLMIPCSVTFNIPNTDQPIPQPNMTTQNHHDVNPYYRPEPLASFTSFSASCDAFRAAILSSYAALRARREAQYESELVPLSNKPGAPLIPQYKLPLN